MRRVIVTILGVWLLISACAEPSCLEQSENFINEVDGLTREWEDASEIAGSTSRISLSGPIQNLQAIRRQAEDVEVPECAADVKEALVDYMDGEVDMFLAFMSDSDVDLRSDMSMSDARLSIFTTRMNRLRSGDYDNTASD